MVISALFLSGKALSADSIGVRLLSAGPVSDGTYDVLPYELSVNGMVTDADCYDALDQTAINQTWRANELTLDQAAAYGQFSLGISAAEAMLGYEEVAWLSAQPAITAANQIDLQHTIWNVFDPGAAFEVSAELLASVTAAAQNNFGAFDFDNYVFLEAVPEEGVNLAEAFVLYVPGGNNAQNPTETPEPGAAIPVFIGLGLIGVSRVPELLHAAERRKASN
jgi:hypothetical protein